MQLTEAQQTAVRQWVEAGCSLTDIQKRLNEEFKLALTYMDVRFLVLDLGIKMKDKPTPSAKGADLSKAPAPGTPAAELEEDLPPTGGGRVAVEIDRIMKPGALVSGTVKFSDGVKASWSLDQFGRLGLAAAKPGYRPSPADLQDFQQELTRLIQKHGY